LASPALTCSLM